MSETLLSTIGNRVLVGDGAMGTQLQMAGLEPGGCGEAWNLARPERVLAIQRGYVAAGSDCLITNTFGGSRIMLERYGHAGDTAAINRAGVRIAREAFGGRPGFVLGDVGPFGGLMEPYGEIAPRRVRDAFREQADALVEAGADAIIIETQTALEELALALEAARAAGAPCVIGSLAFDVILEGTDLRTMMGVSPEEAAELLQQAGADVAALNCGSGVDVVWAARGVERLRKVCPLPTMAQPNAGTPVLENLKVVYRQTPEEMAAGVPALLSAGAAIVGACCGSTPEHIRLIRRIVDRHLEARKRMKFRIGPESADADRLIPPAHPDGSRIGVNYADAYLKALGASLDDGRKVTAKRKGLKVLLTIGEAKGEAVMRRLEHGPDPRAILRRALEAAAREAGARFVVEDGVVYLEADAPGETKCCPS